MARSRSANSSPQTAEPAEPRASGRFLLRLDPGLHAALRKAARAEHVSLNEYCVRKLAAPGDPIAGRGAWREVMERAAASFGDDLLAVVVFGSWARGEASDESDVDLLIVVDDRVELRRELYDRWDRGSPEVAIDGASVDVHIAHPPDPERFSPSVWGEIAIDGIVLFERAHTLSKRLAQIRRRIAAGELTRRSTAGGQPYWIDLRTPSVEPHPGHRDP